MCGGGSTKSFGCIGVGCSPLLVSAIQDFPTSLHECVFYLLHHLPFYLDRFGPIIWILDVSIQKVQFQDY